MKKLALLICTLFFLSPLASQAACPCKTTQQPCPVQASPCAKAEKPKCGCGKTNCGCKTEKQCDPCKKCAKPDKSCCEEKNCCDSIIKQESPCWGMSQQELFKCLGLDQCQMQKASCMYQQYLNDTQPLKDRLTCEENKLCSSDCLSKDEQKAIKKDIKELKNEIKDRWNAYSEEFEYILCKDQVKKYKELNKEYNKEYKALKKNNCQEPCGAAPIQPCGCDPCKK